MNDAFQPPVLPGSPPPPTSTKAYAIAALLLVAMFLERTTHYGVATVLPVWLVGPLELHSEDVFFLRDVLALLSPLAMVAAGLAAFYQTSHRILIISAALISVAYLGLITEGAIPLWLCFGLISAGKGMFKPVFYALLVCQFRGPRSPQRIAALMGVAVMTHLGGFAGPFTMPLLRELAWTWVFVVAAIAMALVTLIGVLTNHLAAYPAVDSTPVIHRRTVIRALLAVPIYWLWWTTIRLAEAPFRPYDDLPMWVVQASIIATVLAGLTAMFALALLATDHIQVHEPTWMGSVLVATALFALPICWPVTEHSDTVRYGLYYALALPQSIMPALVLSWLTRDLPQRTVPLLIAVYLFTPGWGYVGELGLTALLPHSAVLPVVVLLCGLTGLVLLRLPSDTNAISSKD